MKIKHNGSYTRIYGIYHGMLHRCYKPYCKIYKHYGARGITVCDEWRGEKGFENFRDWAFKNGYADDLTIDRIDNDGNYSPDNCRWATYKTQRNNSSQNHYIKYNGKVHTLTEWAEIFQINPCTISFRLRKGWKIEDALTRPAHAKRESIPTMKHLQKDKYGYAIKINNKYYGRAKTLEEAIAKRDSILGVAQ